MPRHRNPQVTRVQQQEGQVPTTLPRRVPVGGKVLVSRSLFWGAGQVGGQGAGHRGPLASGQRSGRQGALHPRGPARPCRSLWRWRSGLNHCLLLSKAFALLQFHHILNSWAAHAASQLLDLERRQPHAHGRTQPEPARRARGWKRFLSRSVPDTNDRNK